MSIKPVFEKIENIQRSYIPLCGHTTFVLMTLARNMTIIDTITIFCIDVNNTSTSVELLAINILRNMSSSSSNVELSQRLEEWNGHNAFVHPHKFDELLQ